MRVLNDAARFLLELTALYAFGSCAHGLVHGSWRYVWSAAAVCLAVCYWGVLIAPKSPRRLAEPARFAAEVVFFAVAAAALFAVGRGAFGLVLGAGGIANAALLRVVGTAAP